MKDAVTCAAPRRDGNHSVVIRHGAIFGWNFAESFDDQFRQYGKSGRLETTSMAFKRRMMGKIIIAARILGGILIALAILSLPQVEFLPAGLADTFRWISSIALMVAGIAWLVGVQLFIRFFDQYLSRN
jgi:hypothetical protein